ncbi:hypothetical protein K8I28_03910 [bacterium]|nr:hypothetical protein [bacterium]
MNKWGVHSEVGRLQAVMMHQPGWEHARMMPWNKDAMLFDDIIDIDFARPEHKELVNILTTQDVRVIHFADLLKDVCSDAEEHEELVREVVDPDLLQEIDPKDIQPSHLIIGYPASFRFEDRVVMQPLPNFYFMRDPAFFIGNRLIVSHLHYPIRQRESKLVRGVIARHPIFEGVTIYDGILNDPEATIEGGDVLVANNKTVLVGISERTNEHGADHLARYLFEQTGISRVCKIFIPHLHEFMHLDTLMTFVDRQQIVTLPLFWDRPDIYAEVARRVQRQCEKWQAPYRGPSPEALEEGCSMKVLFADGEERHYANVLEGLAALNVIVPEITVTVGGPQSLYRTMEEHVQEALREQWNDAANTFALKPGTVLCYSRNAATRRALEQNMVEVIEFIGGELVRGRGGPRCMTMPLMREFA